MKKWQELLPEETKSRSYVFNGLWMMVYQNMKNRTVLIVYDTFWLVLGLFWLFTICYVSSYLETFWFGTSEKKVLALKKCWFWYISKDAFTNIIQIMIQYNDTLQWNNDTMTGSCTVNALISRTLVMILRNMSQI